ncbi:MAG: hypothetical protein Q9M97_02770 [Candidatus Gracilibacteria bacterium]|nr:hypothetical protein [Candidatus Gracilibacteria bacterium]
MGEKQNLQYNRDDGTKINFNKDTNLTDEIDKFKTLDKTELKALHYILYNNRGKEKEIAKNTTLSSLKNLYNELNKSKILGNMDYMKKRVKNILNMKKTLPKKVQNNNEVNNKKQSYRTLKSEARNIRGDKGGKIKIQNFQIKIGAYSDGNFGPNTFIKYKKANPNWQNESINDYLVKNTKVTKKAKKGFWEDILDGFDKKEETTKGLDKEYPSINNIDEMKKILENKSITIQDITQWLKKGWRTVMVTYTGGKTDRVNVSELRKLHNEIINAGDYVKNNTKKGIEKSKKVKCGLLRDEYICKVILKKKN